MLFYNIIMIFLVYIFGIIMIDGKYGSSGFVF